MSAAAVDLVSVFEIAQDVFAAMIDGDEGLLVPRDAVTVPDSGIVDPVVAWVDVYGPHPGRIAVTCGRETVDALVRALLDVDGDAPIAEDDREDGFGEIANVVGGNVKALLPEQGTLGLPHVGRSLPPIMDPLVLTLRLAWRGEPLDIAIWIVQEEGGSR